MEEIETICDRFCNDFDEESVRPDYSDIMTAAQAARLDMLEENADYYIHL